MKYTSSNKPLVCMQTQSTCFKGTRTMTPKGVLWHSTGANNANLKRYVQPSDVAHKEDTYSKDGWLKLLGKNSYKNDWNHIERQAGLNCWIGKLADGTVTTVQTMPWDYRPWGCGSGSKGSCNDGWIQFEICEDGLTDKTYFDKVYKEACEITAYLCKMFNIDPNGSVTHNGVKVPTILCHADSYKLGLGSNHGDINHWFKKHGKTMDNVREDVAVLLKTVSGPVSESTSTPTTVKTYKVVTSINKYASSADAAAQKNSKGTYAAGTYYIYNKYPDGVNGMYNISADKTGTTAGSWINPKENVVAAVTLSSIAVTTKPKKITYKVGESYDGSGMVVTATYSDKSTKVVTGYTTSGFTSTKAGTVTINVTFEGKATKFTVTVEEKEVVQETVKEPEKVVAVYDLDYPEKNKIVDKNHIGTNINCTKAIKKILTNNSTFDVEIAKAFFKLAPKYGIDPMMAIAQSILETGWFKYTGSAVTADQHNYCGLGVTSTGVKGAAFTTIEDGVTAQLQHLFAYGCKDALPMGESVLDPRFSLVTRGIAPYWQQLAGRWACPGYDKVKYVTPEEAMAAEDTYGQKIRNIYTQLIDVAITDEEVEKYFGKDISSEDTPEEAVPETEKPDPEVEEPTSDKEPEDVKQPEEDEKVTNLATLIFNVIKKLIQMFADIFNKK